MGVGDLLRQEQTVARHRAGGFEVWFREYARRAEAGEGRHGEGHFGGLEVLACKVAAAS